MDPPSLKCAIFSGCLSSANEGVIVRSKWRRALSEKSGDFGGISPAWEFHGKTRGIKTDVLTIDPTCKGCFRSYSLNSMQHSGLG